MRRSFKCTIVRSFPYVCALVTCASVFELRETVLSFLVFSAGHFIGYVYLIRLHNKLEIGQVVCSID